MYFSCNIKRNIEITSCLVIMNWDFVVLSLIYFRTASILFDLKNLNLSKHFERLTGRINSLFTRNSLDLT